MDLKHFTKLPGRPFNYHVEIPPCHALNGGAQSNQAEDVEVTEPGHPLRHIEGKLRFIHHAAGSDLDVGSDRAPLRDENDVAPAGPGLLVGMG